VNILIEFSYHSLRTTRSARRATLDAERYVPWGAGAQRLRFLVEIGDSAELRNIIWPKRSHGGRAECDSNLAVEL
jgi:hypothetical protein